ELSIHWENGMSRHATAGVREAQRALVISALATFSLALMHVRRRPRHRATLSARFSEEAHQLAQAGALDATDECRALAGLAHEAGLDQGLEMVGKRRGCSA